MKNFSIFLLFLMVLIFLLVLKPGGCLFWCFLRFDKKYADVFVCQKVCSYNYFTRFADINLLQFFHPPNRQSLKPVNIFRFAVLEL